MKHHARLVHFTDLHVSPVTEAGIPDGRTKTYHEDCAFEWKSAMEEFRKQGALAVLMSGDFFNLKNSDRYGPRHLLHFSDLVRRFEIPWFVIPGNHDLPQSSMDNWGDSALKALIQMTPNMHNVMDQVVFFHPAFLITGLAFYPNEEMFENHLHELNSRPELVSTVLKIALLHMDAMPPGAKPLPHHWGSASYVDVLDTIPNIDLVCGGHIHQGAPIYSRPNPSNPQRTQSYSRPWSFGRVAKDYHATAQVLEDLHRPSYTLIDITFDDRTGDVDTKLEYHEIPHVPFAKAFAPERLESLIAAKMRVNELSEKVDELVAGGFDVSSPDQIYAELPMTQPIRDLINSYLEK